MSRRHIPRGRGRYVQLRCGCSTAVVAARHFCAPLHLGQGRDGRRRLLQRDRGRPAPEQAGRRLPATSGASSRPTQRCSYWYPTMTGATSIGDIYGRAVAFSLRKVPGLRYYGIGVLKNAGSREHGYLGVVGAGLARAAAPQHPHQLLHRPAQGLRRRRAPRGRETCSRSTTTRRRDRVPVRADAPGPDALDRRRRDVHAARPGRGRAGVRVVGALPVPGRLAARRELSHAAARAAHRCGASRNPRGAASRSRQTSPRPPSSRTSRRSTARCTPPAAPSASSRSIRRGAGRRLRRRSSAAATCRRSPADTASSGSGTASACVTTATSPGRATAARRFTWTTMPRNSAPPSGGRRRWWLAGPGRAWTSTATRSASSPSMPRTRSSATPPGAAGSTRRATAARPGGRR